jgi:hypothetical protein
MAEGHFPYCKLTGNFAEAVEPTNLTQSGHPKSRRVTHRIQPSPTSFVNLKKRARKKYAAETPMTKIVTILGINLLILHC